MRGRVDIAEGTSFSLDTHETYLNNNVLVIGTSGSGKTRSIVSPNILEATGSYVISDPKGKLYREYGAFLKMKGYKIRTLNLCELSKSDGYNFFDYVRSEQDIVKIARILNYMESEENSRQRGDIFWDQTAEMLISAAIAYQYENYRPKERTLYKVFRLLEMLRVDEDNSSAPAPLDLLMADLEKKNRNSFAVRQYKKVRESAGRTLKSILVSARASIGKLDFSECNRVTGRDEMRLADIGKEKTAIFVIVSDTERSMDGLANLFFNQAINELCRVADETKEGRLPVPVRFILDDFATNVKIENFPRMIASIRSREISVMIMIQALSQLKAAYGEDGTTIMGNCDTMVYLGTSDVETAQNIAERIDRPLHDILYMPINTNWVFRRGQEPINGTNINLEAFSKEKIR